MTFSIEEHFQRMVEATRLREVDFLRAKRFYALAMATMTPSQADFDTALLRASIKPTTRKQIDDFISTTDASFAGVFGIPLDSLPLFEDFAACCIACGRNSCLETNSTKLNTLTQLAGMMDEQTYAKIADAGRKLQRYIAQSSYFSGSEATGYIQ